MNLRAPQSIVGGELRSGELAVSAPRSISKVGQAAPADSARAGVWCRDFPEQPLRSGSSALPDAVPTAD